MSCLFLYHISAGTMSGLCFEGTRFLKYTTVCTTSSQYFVGNPESTSIDLAVSNIVCILYSAAPFYWWACAVVNLIMKPCLFLNSVHSQLSHSQPLSTLTCNTFFPVSLSVSARNFFSMLRVASAIFSLKNSTYQNADAPSMINMK